MSREELIGKILTATPAQIEAAGRALEAGADTPTQPGDRRLLTLTQAAAALGVSRMTIFRMIKDGRLQAVEIRNGRQRVPSAVVTAFAKGG